MNKGCDRPIYRDGDWYYCGESGKFCALCYGDRPAMTDDEVAASIIRSHLASGVRRGDRAGTIVVASLLIIAMLCWVIFK